VATTGTVVRFDRRRGYGFVAPDDGGEDVFVHQNNINMEGFRFLQVGERVNYELEVGEKGMKAVSVALVEPRVIRPGREDGGEGYEDGGGDDRDSRDSRDAYPPRAPRDAREPRPHHAPSAAPRRASGDDQGLLVEKLRRKQERLISLLVEKGLLTPGEIDGLDGNAAAKADSGHAEA
jgi:cold shock CspA family protein